MTEEMKKAKLEVLHQIQSLCNILEEDFKKDEKIRLIRKEIQHQIVMLRAE